MVRASCASLRGPPMLRLYWPKGAVWIVFEPMPQESWGVGETLVSDVKK